MIQNGHMLRRNWKRIVVCVSKQFIEMSSLRNTLATYGKTNLWLKPPTGKQNRAPNHIHYNDHLPTTYWPPTDHLPATYWPPTCTDHFTDHLPTTFLRCSLFTITVCVCAYMCVLVTEKQKTTKVTVYLHYQWILSYPPTLLTNSFSCFISCFISWIKKCRCCYCCSN